MWYETILNWLDANPLVKQLAAVFGIAAACYLSFFISRRYIVKWLDRMLQGLVKRTRFTFDDIIFKAVISRRLAYLPPILILYYSAYLVPAVTQLAQRVGLALMLWIVLLTIGSFLNTLNEHYEQGERFKGRPIKGYVQVIMLFVYIVGSMVTIGILTGQSPWVLFSGIGALTAVVILIFRDTILSFVASLQITSNDLVRINDWIEVPKYNADGDVVEIALHTVKIQNFDKTITIIPTHKLIDQTFKNWRGMQESGGRRIKRSITIDLDSVRFLDDPMLQRLEKIEILKPYLQSRLREIDESNRKLENFDPSSPANGRRLTNIGTYRRYIEAYLKHHKSIHDQMTFLVRQLAPAPTGLPIEIYVFTNDTNWIKYEEIQSDIFDHLLAVAGEFGLRIFQYPSSAALRPEKRTLDS